jgi:hypothetical protein
MIIKFISTLFIIVVSFNSLQGQAVTTPDSSRTKRISTPTSDTMISGIDYFYENKVRTRSNSVTFSNGIKKITRYTIFEEKMGKSIQKNYNDLDSLTFITCAFDTLVSGQLGVCTKVIERMVKCLT